MKEQGCKIFENTVYRENTSAMKMEINGKKVQVKNKTFRNQIFYVTDLIERKEVEVKYCRTDFMAADCWMKRRKGDER
jgi:hypothetical protein